MVTIVIVNLVVMALAQVAALRRSKRWLLASFLVLFAFLAIRYDFGNDYMGYLGHFESMDRLREDLRLEVGWQALSLLFQPLGFFAMVAALAAFNLGVLYGFVARYVPAPYFGYAVFLYVFNPHLMLVQSSAMRQTLALSFFLLALRFVENRCLWKYALLIAVAASFHTSAMVLLPIYWLATPGRRMGEIVAVGLFAAFLSAILLVGELRPWLGRVVTSYAERYEMYEAGTELGSGLGLIYAIAVFGVILYCGRNQVGDRAMLFRVAVASYFMTYPMGMINSTAARLGMYLTPSLLAVVPLASSTFRDRKVGGIVLAGIATMTLYEFYMFFQSDIWREPFGTYRTIFSAPGYF